MSEASIMKRAVALVLVAALASSCATGPRDADGHPRTALDRSIGQCIVSIGLGAIAGALLGAAINRRGGAGTGAAIGAGAGAVECAIIVAVNNEEDRARIRQAEQAAYSSGQGSTTQYAGEDGTARIIKTSVQTVATPTQPAGAGDGEVIVGPCRRAQTSITVGDKGTVALPPELVCRTAQGDYVPYSGKTTA